MDTTIRADSPAELIAYVPHRLGFQPAESIVLVSLRRDGCIVGLVARADIADIDHTGSQTLIRHLERDGAQRVVQILYSDDGSGRPGEYENAVARHLESLARATIGPSQTWWVSKTGYGCLNCADSECCPPRGHSLTHLESTQVGAHMVVAGSLVASSRAEAYTLADADARRRGAVLAAVERARRRRARGLDSWLRDGLKSWRRAVDLVGEGELPAGLVGRIAMGLQDVRVRDAVLLQLVRTDEDLADQTAAGVQGGDVADRTGAAIAAIVDPDIGVPPNRAVTDPAIPVLEAVMTSTEGTSRAAAATLLALMAWWQGDGGRAGERLRDALHADPHYRLAHLLDAALNAGLAPGWLRAAR